jgi:hypothetical protein
VWRTYSGLSRILNPVPIRLVHDRWVSKYVEGENLEVEPTAAAGIDDDRAVERRREAGVPT